jgi:hypothetical protein
MMNPAECRVCCFRGIENVLRWSEKNAESPENEADIVFLSKGRRLKIQNTKTTAAEPQPPAAQTGM